VRKLVLQFTFISIIAILSAAADQVSLKNGDRLSGTLVKSDGKTLVLHTDYAGDVTLKWDAVQGIQAGEPLHVELQDGRKAVGTVSTSDDKIQIATPGAGPVEAPVSNVKTLRNDAEEKAYEKTLRPGLLQEWKTGLNAGFALTGGNSETKNLSIGFLAARQTLHDKLGLYANSVYASNDAAGAIPSTTANTAGGGLRYDHDLRDRVFAFGAADFFSDALQTLNIRSVFGGGLGYHAIKNDNTTLDLLAGLNYTHESYTGLTRNFAALTIGEELMHKLGKSTVLNESLAFYPNLNDLGEYRGTFAFGTITKMNKWLGWQNSFSDIYVTNPPLGKKQNDIILTTGLSVTLGQ
jgi:putative salt-induced outer membrane protein YdiY/small nuclear ribonucleoprotein (snRNP)-like protein